METPIPVLLTKSGYADYLGINEKAVRKAIIENKIVKGWDATTKKIIVAEADKEYGFLHKVARDKAGVSKAKTAVKLSGSPTVYFQGNDRQQAKLKNKKSESPKDSESENLAKSESPKMTDKDASNMIVDELMNVPVTELLGRIVLHEGLQYNESIRLKMLLEVCKDKQQLELFQGTLVKKDDVAKVLYAVGSQLKKAILAMPARIIPDIRAANDNIEAKAIMIKEINSILAHYANFNNTLGKA